MYEADDPVIKRIPHQISQSPQSSVIHTLLSELQYQYFNDSHLSQDILTIMANSITPNFDDSPSSIDHHQTNARTQTPFKPTSIQSLPFFDTSFFAHCKALKTSSSHRNIFNNSHSSSGSKR